MSRKAREARLAVEKMFGIEADNVCHARNHLALPKKPRRKLIDRCMKAGWLELTWDDVECDITAEEIEELEK